MIRRGDLIHYSAEPLGEVKSIGQSHKYLGYMLGKPTGLWVSVLGADDWSSWCRSEGFALECLAVATRVVLTDNAHVLRLSSEAEVCAFADAFGRDGRFEPWIDWRAVASEYAGVIIAPYQWSLRLAQGFSWYYGWDCASGCIWDADAIARIEPLRDRRLSLEAAA